MVVLRQKRLMRQNQNFNVDEIFSKQDKKMRTNYKDILDFFARYIAPSIAAHKLQAALSILLLILSTMLFILAMELSRLVIQGVQQTLGDHWLVAPVAAIAGGSPGGLLAGLVLIPIEANR